MGFFSIGAKSYVALANNDEGRKFYPDSRELKIYVKEFKITSVALVVPSDDSDLSIKLSQNFSHNWESYSVRNFEHLSRSGSFKEKTDGHGINISQPINLRLNPIEKMVGIDFFAGELSREKFDKYSSTILSTPKSLTKNKHRKILGYRGSLNKK